MKTGMVKRGVGIRKIRTGLVLSAGLAVLVSGCSKPGPGPATAQANQEAETKPSAQHTPLSEFEKDLQYVRNGLYTYIWVFSRKDGKSLDKDDAAYLRKNAPQVVDWVGTDGGKRYIAGTNFDLEKGNLETLKKRFVIEDYSAR